jgi:integrase
LNVGHVDLPNRIIVVWNSRFGKHITPNKSRRPRAFSLSPQLALTLLPMVSGRQADAALFLSRRGKRLSPDNFVKRELKPILNKLGLDGALHAFRHGNATALDHMNARLKVRQESLGHVTAKRTMGYTHLASEDDPLAVRQAGRNFVPKCAQVGTRTVG